MNKLQLLRCKKLWRTHSQTVASFDLRKIPPYIKKDIPKSEYDLAIHMPIIPVDNLIVVNENFPEYSTLKNFLVALDTLPHSLAASLYESEKQRYSAVGSADISDSDSESEKARKIIFMFLPELLKAQGKKHL